MTINPHPKPARKQKSPPRPLGRSEKPIRRSNPKRRKSEFARCYHSKERVEFVKGLPCVACGMKTISENAHIESGGKGRKADFTKIVPLCGYWHGVSGCHAELHRIGRASFEARHGIGLEACAAVVEAAWLRVSGTPE